MSAHCPRSGPKSFCQASFALRVRCDQHLGWSTSCSHACCELKNTAAEDSCCKKMSAQSLEQCKRVVRRGWLALCPTSEPAWRAEEALAFRALPWCLPLTIQRPNLFSLWCCRLVVVVLFVTLVLEAGPSTITVWRVARFRCSTASPVTCQHAVHTVLRSGSSHAHARACLGQVHSGILCAGL